jgi:hypothetical protein
MKYRYVKEKLREAIYTLSTGKNDVRSRLVAANMGFYVLTEDHFPPEFRNDWKWIMHQLNKYGSLYDDHGELLSDSVKHTMQRIRKDTGQKIARKIFDISWALHTNKKYQ